VSVLVSVADSLPKPMLHTQLELEAEVGIEQQVQFSLLQFYYPTARGVQRHNYRMTVESGLCSSPSSLLNSSATLRTLLSKNSATGTFTGCDMRSLEQLFVMDTS
jgi:hypothetical protein